MKKRIISLLIVLSMIMSLGIMSFGNEINKITVEQETLKNKAMFLDIPIYKTYYDKNSGIDKAKVEAKAYFAEDLKSNSNIVKVSENEKANLLENPIYHMVFKQWDEVIEENKDLNITHINIFIPENKSSVTKSSNDPNDPSYWEKNAEYLGSYEGYKFLYIESEARVESSWVEAGNVTSGLNWTDIFTYKLEYAMDKYVKNAIYDTAKLISSTISTMIGFYETPFSVTYGSTEGDIQSKVKGTLYARTVFIEDKLDRISGYAYYSWGSTQMFDPTLLVEVTYPISQRTSTTYNYETENGSYNAARVSTPGFNGNSTLYESVLQLYEKTWGYFTHDESVDVNNTISNLLIK